ncbi:MAG: amidohydrolase family protein [Actinobacteria bacterium]|nr:amidohydrolase family protein [Actinomycetota bacterium]
MTDVVVKGIGSIISGDLASPLADGDTVVVRDGLISAVGFETDCDTSGIGTVIDAGGATVIPGLHDNHIHPVIGDFTPRQRTFDFIDSCMHGGVSTMLSAGEPHVPGRPTDPAGVKALAILAHKSFANLRPSGVKVHAGAVLLEEGLVEADFDDLAAAGCRLVGEIGISGLKDPVEAAQMTRWAQARDMRVMVHTGGASIPGSGVIDADFVGEVKPDVAGHVNGGPTSLPVSDVIRILDETDAHIELVHNGNIVTLGQIARLADERGELDRVVIGTDCPAGSGVQPLGVLRVLSYVAAFGGIDPAKAVALATGNTASMHNLNRGVIKVGAEGDLAIVDTPMGSQATDAMGALAIGDTMAVAGLIIDGIVRFDRSRNTPPPTRTITFTGTFTG